MKPIYIVPDDQALVMLASELGHNLPTVFRVWSMKHHAKKTLRNIEIK